MLDQLTPERGEFLRAPPHNYDAERALLGAILMNNRALEKVADYLRPEHFADPANGAAFEVIVKLIGEGGSASATTLKGAFEANEFLAAAGSMKYLAALAASAITVINADEYGRIILDCYRRRELIALAEDIRNAAFDTAPAQASTDIIEEAETRLHALTEDDSEDHAADIGALYDAALARWQAHDRGERTGVPSGFIDLDAGLGLLEDGDFCVTGGRPGMCKTTFERNRGYNVARHFRDTARKEKTKPKWVLFFSAEMTRGQMTDGIIASRANVLQPRQRQRALDTDEWQKILAQAEDLRTLPFRVIDKAAPTLSFIRSTCRRMQRRGGVGLIIVDYLQIMGVEPSARTNNRVLEVSYLARGLKETAKLFKCPIIALSQLSRAVENREDNRPHMGDLRESGEIEAAADQVILMYRPLYYEERDKPQPSAAEKEGTFLQRLSDWQEACDKAEGVLEVGIGKSRFGEAGKTVTLHVDLARGTISNAAKPYHEGTLS